MHGPLGDATTRQSITHARLAMPLSLYLMYVVRAYEIGFDGTGMGGAATT